MSGETITLDPTGIATGRTQLDITSYVAAAGPNWGDAEIQAYVADQTYGSSVVDYRIPNRTITIPLNLRTLGATLFSTTRASVQSKTGMFQREGGWIGRLVGATQLYADVVSATLHLGGAWLQAYRDADVDAVLTLECLPDWYGDETVLSDHVETTLPHLFFTEAAVAGTYPARVRIVVDNDQATDQHGLLWGVRSRQYSGTTTAALFYEAESLVKVNGAAGTALAGASGGTAVTITSPPQGEWVSMLALQLTAGSAWFTHTGSYRVWGRCYSAGAIPPSYRLQWGPASLSTPVTNAGAALAGTANFYLLDLGGIRIDAPPVGSNQWQGVIQTMAVGTADVASIDCVYFQPLDEDAGRLVASTSSSPSAIAATKSPTVQANNAATGTNLWTWPFGANKFPAMSTPFLTAGQLSEYLQLSGFGFSILSGATITGIQVNMIRERGSPDVQEVRVSLVKTGSVIQTANKSIGAIWASHLSVTFGGPTDLWGTTWSPADVNAAGFGAVVAVKNPGVNNDAQGTVDDLTITVYYTLAGGFTVAADAVAYASQSVELRTDGMFREDSTGTVFGPVSSVVGDLPRLPNTSEGRTTQLFLKFSRGDFDQQPDSGIDDISARITYRPSYLITP